MMVGGWYAGAVLVLFLPWFFLSYFPRKERTESARLEELHGPAFTRYREQVPALIPRLVSWTPSDAPAIGEPDRRWSLARYSENNELGTLLALVACALAFGLRTFLALGGA